MIRPSYRVGPPLNLGELGAGTLKADEWKQLIEFDVPVSLATMWHSEICSKTINVHKLLFEATMHLAIVVRLGTLHSITESQVGAYETFTANYLWLIHVVRPNMNLLANQHNLLHFAKYLRLYGLCRSWWMFPYERLIGELKSVNHNKKVGQVEGTIFRTYNGAAHLRGYLRSACKAYGLVTLWKFMSDYLRPCQTQQEANTPAMFKLSRIKWRNAVTLDDWYLQQLDSTRLLYPTWSKI
jgi:hypothetical protein